MPGHSIDVILGDQIRENVPVVGEEKLYQEIHRLLKPTGLHITRITSRFFHTKIYSQQELVEKFSHIAPNKESVTEFLNHFMFQTHHNGKSGTDYLFLELEKYFDRPYIREYHQEFQNILPPHQEWNIGRSWEEDRKPIDKFFDIVGQVQDDTIFSDSSYIFALRPKSNTKAL